VKTDAHIRQMARVLAANPEFSTLVLRSTFVLGSLTAKSDKTRIVFMFNCEGATLLPALLGRYWKKDRQLAMLEAEKSKEEEEEKKNTVSAKKECDAVLVKLVRLVANVALSPSCGTMAAASSAVVEPLMDMLGCKKIEENEELVLNVVAAITNLLFYDVPSNILLSDADNKRLLCRLFRPLLLESYNTEAQMEAARALGNLSRHEDVRTLIVELRLDEVLTILIDHEDRDLVYYVCGVLVNLAADVVCAARLVAEFWRCVELGGRRQGRSP